MFNLFYSSLEKITGLLESWGYPGVLFLSLLDRLTVFLIPAEIVLPVFGILIGQEKFLFWPVLFWVTLGNFIGNLLLFWIFRKGGRPFLEKHGRYFLISRHELGHLDSWFLKYGDKIVFFGYFIPTAVRSLIPIPAGLSLMSLRKFSLYTFLGSLPLNVLYIYAGMKAEAKLNAILQFFDRLNYLVIVAIILFAFWYIYRHKHKKHATH